MNESSQSIETPSIPAGNTTSVVNTDELQKKLANISTGTRISHALTLFSPLMVLAPIGLLVFAGGGTFARDIASLVFSIITAYVIYCLSRSIGLALGWRPLLALHVLFGAAFVLLRGLGLFSTLAMPVWTPLTIYLLLMQWTLLKAVWNLLAAGKEDRLLLRSADPNWFALETGSKSTKYFASRLLKWTATFFLALSILLPNILLLAALGPVSMMSAMSQFQAAPDLGSLAGINFLLGGAALLVAPIFVVICLFVSGRALFFSRRLARLGAEKAMADDPRDPILFLRSFRDDQVGLPRRRYDIFDRLLAFGDKRDSLDHLLVDEFRWAGPIVAIGRPGEADTPFGAARLYVPDSEWRQKVLDLAKRSVMIILVVDTTEGVRWEIENIAETGFGAKTLLIVRPAPPIAEGQVAGANTTDLPQILDGLGFEGAVAAVETMAAEPPPVFAVFRPFTSDPTVFRSPLVDAYAFRLALRRVFRSCLPAEQLAVSWRQLIRRWFLPIFAALSIIAIGYVIFQRMLANLDVEACVAQPSTEVCMAALNSSFTSSADKAKAHVGAGMAVFDKPAEALTHFNRAISADPTLHTAYRERGILRATARGSWPLAERDFAKAIALAKMAPGAAAIEIAEGLYEVGAYQRAIVYANLALRAQPRNPYIYDLRGSSYGRLENYERAISDTDIARRLDPGSYDYNNNACWWRAVAGVQLDAAFAACDAAMAIDETSVTAPTNVALILLKSSRFEEAIEIYDAVLEVSPGHAEALYGRGLAHWNLSNGTKAAEDFAAAELSNPAIRTEYEKYGLLLPPE